MGLQCAELAGILMTSRNTPPFSSPKSAYANGPWIQFKGVSFKWGLCPSTSGAVRESDMRKVRDTCLFFFFTQNMIQLACTSLLVTSMVGVVESIGLHHAGVGWGCREWVNPTNCDCVFKMWCSAGGKAGPIQVHAPVWKRGERLWGSKLKE